LDIQLLANLHAASISSSCWPCFNTALTTVHDVRDRS